MSWHQYVAPVQGSDGAKALVVNMEERVVVLVGLAVGNTRCRGVAVGYGRASLIYSM